MAPHCSSSRRLRNDTPYQSKTSSPQDLAVRAQTLAGLLPLWAAELNDTSQAGRLKVLAKLRRALRIERKNGSHGAWTYNLARHKALLDAYRQEVESLRCQKRIRKPTPARGITQNKPKSVQAAEDSDDHRPKTVNQA